MPRVSTLLLALVLAACGARTELSVEPPAREDAGPPGPCSPMTPEPLPGPGISARAVDGDRIWGTFTPGLNVGWVDARTGERTTAAEDQLGVRSIVAEGGDAWWTQAGFSDFAGELVHARGGRSPRAIDDGLFQPGGVQLGARYVFYAEWTNSGSLRDEMRGRMLRIPRGGGDVTELATGLGLPTGTALTDRFLYWVDRRRNHVARVGRAGGEVEIVAADLGGVSSALAAHDGEVFFGVPTGREVEIRRFDERIDAVDVVATAPTEVRGLIAIEEGLLLSLWYGRDRIGEALGFLPRDGAEVIELLPSGSSPAVGPRHVYWTATGEESRLVRLCRDALPR
ncbi:MAG: hypothetical protein R3B82_20495 [Sandaracinaceae bacterium]